MLLVLGRVSLCAALAIFVFASVAPSHGQEAEASQAAGEQTGQADHGDAAHADAADHDTADHGAADHGAADDGTADHGDGHGDPAGTPPLLSVDIGSAVCNIAIFLGVLAILSKFVWPVILNGLQAREDKIHSELEAAAQANSEAKTLLDEYQSKLDAAASQVQSMLSDARKEAEASSQRIVEEAKSEASRQRQRAVADIETAKKAALAELAGQTSDMAINVAKQVVGRELKADDHADLIRQALDQLPSNN